MPLLIDKWINTQQLLSQRWECLLPDNGSRTPILSPVEGTWPKSITNSRRWPFIPFKRRKIGQVMVGTCPFHTQDFCNVQQRNDGTLLKKIPKGKICLICMNCNPKLMLKEHAPGVPMKLCSMNLSPSVWKRFILYQPRPVSDFWQKYDKKLACPPFSRPLSSFSLPLCLPFSLSSTLRVHLLLILMLIMSKTPKNKNLSNRVILKKKKQNSSWFRKKMEWVPEWTTLSNTHTRRLSVSQPCPSLN